MSKGKQRRRSPTPPDSDHHESGDDTTPQDTPSQPPFQDYFSRKDAPGKQILRSKGKPALKATKAEATKEAITLLRRPDSTDDSKGSRSRSKGSSSSRKSSSEVKGGSRSRPQLRVIGSVCLVPRGIEDGVDEMKIPDEELESLANYQLKVSCHPDGSRLKIDLDWDEDQVLEWLQSLFAPAYAWIMDEIAGTDETRWCLFARRKHSKYHIVSEQHPDLTCSANYIYGTLNTGHQGSSRIVFVSSIPIPEKVYRQWRTGSARKRAAESDEEGSGDVVPDPRPGPSSNRRRRIEHTDEEPASASAPRNPASRPSRHHRTASSTQSSSSKSRSARKSPIVITSDSEADLPALPGPSTTAASPTEILPAQVPPPSAPANDISSSLQPQAFTPSTSGVPPSTSANAPLTVPDPSIFLPSIQFSDPIEPDIDPYANF